MIAIQGAYTKITTALAVPNLYNIDPFDLYGNLLSEMTIEVDSTLAQPAIFLPAIADLNNNWQIKINIIAKTGSVFPVFIGVANPPDKIGAAYDVSLVSDGANIEINPIGDNNWYGVPADIQTVGGAFTPITYNVGYAKDSINYTNEQPIAYAYDATIDNLTSDIKIYQSGAVTISNLDIVGLTDFTSTDITGLIFKQLSASLFYVNVFELPNLEFIYNIDNINGGVFPAISNGIAYPFSLPSLKCIKGATLLAQGGMGGRFYGNTLSVPSLEFLGSLQMSVCAVQITDFSSLKYLDISTVVTNAATLSVNNCNQLTQLNFPNIVKIIGNGGSFAAVNISSCATLANFSFGSTLKRIGVDGLPDFSGNVNISYNALSQQSVDNVLIRLASLDGTNGTKIYSGATINLEGGTNSAPSATGLTAKATLISRGCTITTN